MSKIKGDPKSVIRLLADTKAGFLIPDYQRPYAWTEKECQVLWDDLTGFAIPDDDIDQFKRESEYFLGPIVTFENEENGCQEIIDGQQRITTMMLLLRAIYPHIGKGNDRQTVGVRLDIEECIWKLGEKSELDTSNLKIVSEVATDADKHEFFEILKTGKIPDGAHSNYAENFKFFQDKIDDLCNKYAHYLLIFARRMLDSCIFLPIEAESQDVALKIFSTLNDRGKPLSDADIFKAQLYKFYSGLGKKDEFIGRWKSLEEKSEKIFGPVHGSPMDEAFARYMYFERATKGIKETTTRALRKFYEEDGYSLLKREATFDNINELADFWEAVAGQNKDRFSAPILRRLFVLNYAPNSMWTYMVSVYFMSKRDKDGLLDPCEFQIFLNKITAFIWAFALVTPGVNQLRGPVYNEMINIVQGKPVDFSTALFEEISVRNAFNNFSFNNGRPITKALLVWWAMRDEKQALPKLETKFEIEHIYARKRHELEQKLSNAKNLDSLGNKALLEKTINIRAADYRISDKRAYYLGTICARGKQKEPTCVQELLCLAESGNDFKEVDIENRYKAMLDAFIGYLKENNLIK